MFSSQLDVRTSTYLKYSIQKEGMFNCDKGYDIFVLGTLGVKFLMEK
jgi:hypothetical protein